MDPAYGVELLERSWRLNTELPLQTVLQPKREAVQEAKKDRDGVVLWADGSRLDIGKAGSAVVWFEEKLDKWQEKRRYLGENKDSFDAELWAISDTIEIGIKKTRNGSLTTVTVFTDSQNVNTKDSRAKS